MIDSNTLNKNSEFKIATMLINLVAVSLLLMTFIASQDAFMFCVVSLLPSAAALLLDWNSAHKSKFSTILMFNMIGGMPYYAQLLSDQSLVDYHAALFMSNITNYLIIYGVVIIGRITYSLIPFVIIKWRVLYLARERAGLVKAKENIQNNWDIGEEK